MHNPIALENEKLSDKDTLGMPSVGAMHWDIQLDEDEEYLNDVYTHIFEKEESSFSKEKIDKLEFMKILIFCVSKDSIE